MKYGILVQFLDSVKYVSSSSGRRIQFSDDITNMALFAQEETVAKTIRRIRRDGLEPSGSTMKIARTKFTVDSTVDVDYPAPKSGHALTWQDANVIHYYSGSPKLPISYLSSGQSALWANKERATIFKSYADASAHLEAMKDFHRERKQEVENAIGSNTQTMMYRNRLADETSNIEQLKDVEIVECKI